ncbi:hypothetical protein RB195_013790 [Necator americanus]|uniref:Uncharacterized protein n=1 Tax=Necator americanus TaxID=51031 RepID=A0ABR1DX73_NECAM
MYTLSVDQQTPTISHTPPIRRIRSDSWSRGEVQIMGLAAVVFIMTVAFFGISVVNCLGRLRRRRQLLKRKQMKAVYFTNPSLPPEQHVQGGRPVF